MKNNSALLVLTFLLISHLSFSQAPLKEYTIGHPIKVSLPDYMSRTIGLNSSASFQFKNLVKDVAGFIIEDNKEELRLAEINYTSLNEFYEDFIKDFLADEKDRQISKPIAKAKGDFNFIECDATYQDKDSDLRIYYFVGLVETKTSFYKVLCYGDAKDKDKFKADFQNIFYSLKD
ncbi:hypothetical protein BH11BAC1_BH11BAC1_17220 [soil metagenome]